MAGRVGPSLGPARARIEGAERVVVSPVSCWEVAMLVAKGRVSLDQPVAAWVHDLLGAAGPAGSAAPTPAVAVAAGSLVGFPGDPADRLIFATALVGRLPLVTKDRRLHEAAEVAGSVSTVW